MDLEQLKQKYASALEAIQKNNVRLDDLHMQDEKLFIQGAAPNEECVQLEDSLSKIARQFYGDAKAYTKIFEANTDRLDAPNKKR
jgi:nucleoid-associated protein YgaU